MGTNFVTTLPGLLLDILEDCLSTSGANIAAGPFGPSQVLPNIVRGTINTFWTASTGTAINTMNGAAQTLAQNAWVGRIVKPVADLVGYTGTASALGGTIMSSLSTLNSAMPVIPVAIQGYAAYSRYKDLETFYNDQRRAIAAFEQRLDRYR